MCIRDSFEPVLKDMAGVLAAPVGVVHQPRCRALPEPVSYTHLDVYKRQAVSFPLRYIPILLAVDAWVEESSDRLDHFIVREHGLTERLVVPDQPGLISFGFVE